MKLMALMTKLFYNTFVYLMSCKNILIYTLYNIYLFNVSMALLFPSYYCYNASFSYNDFSGLLLLYKCIVYACVLFGFV
jgi:hypothetical protein